MDTEISASLPLQRMFQWERERPDEVYLTQPMGAGQVSDYTWRETMDQVRRMAAHLRAQGFEPGARIALMSKNCAWWVMADFAILMAGYVSVPLYPTLAAETVRQILEHSESKLLFVGKLDDWDQMKAGVPAGLPCISFPVSPPTDFPTWEDIIARTPPLSGEPVRPATDLATIIYTSGTTGMPKGVMHSFGTFAAAMRISQSRVKISPEDRVLSYLPLSHVAERVGIEMGSLRAGLRIYFADSLDTFARDLARARPTLFFSVPRLWVKFQQGVTARMPQEKLDRMLAVPIFGGYVRRKILKGLGLDQCRIAVGGAAPMPPALLVWFKKLGLEILEGYGMTENCALSHCNELGKSMPGTVGTAYVGVQHRIDPDTGEVQTKSEATMLGYYKEPEKTREAFTADGWLKTGDKGVIDDAGRLKITGRVKDLFKTSKGKYVAPAPIEDKLVGHPGIEACCVAGASYGQPFGIVMLSADAAKKAKDEGARAELAATLDSHLQGINALLDPHEQMDFIAVVAEQWTVENGFITPTLKIKRNKIEDAYGPHFDAWVKQRKPVIWHST